MLAHIEEPKTQRASRAIYEATLEAVHNDVKTADLGGHTLTSEFTDEVIKRVTTKLEVWDSPNSAGVVIDAVRCAKLALDRRIAGALAGPSSYFMKSPPRQFSDHEARERTMKFILGES